MPVGANGRVKIQRRAHPSHAGCSLIGKFHARGKLDLYNTFFTTRIYRKQKPVELISVAEAKQQAIDLRVEQVPWLRFHGITLVSLI